MRRPRHRPPPGRFGCERGSAIAEFALVAPLVVILVVAVMQLALAAHVRATLITAAAEGARSAALAGGDPADGVRRTRGLVGDNLAGDVVESVDARRGEVDGLAVLTVRVTARVPLVGLLGPTGMVVEGHALAER